MTSAALSEFNLTYAYSPIIMTGGIASQVVGAALPMVALTNAVSFIAGLLGNAPIAIDEFSVYFQPLPGGTIIDQQVAMYPFANQQVAANATIQQPITVSMQMICPVNQSLGYQGKSALIQSLQSSWYQHNTSGGLYTVMTPAFIYSDMILTTVTDVSTSLSHQVQTVFKLDFIKPLVSIAAAQQAMNGLMSQIQAGVPSGAPAGAQGGTGGSVSNTTPLAFGYGNNANNAIAGNLGSTAGAQGTIFTAPSVNVPGNINMTGANGPQTSLT